MESLISDEARAMVGQEAGRVSAVVRKRDFQRWAAAVGETNPLYFDDEYARSHGYREAIMPPMMFLSQVEHGVVHLDELRPDGIPEALMDVPLPAAPRRMAGGETHEFFAPVYDGDVITAVRTIARLEEKQGRSGRFVIIYNTTVYTSQHGEVVGRSMNEVIART